MRLPSMIGADIQRVNATIDLNGDCGNCLCATAIRATQLDGTGSASELCDSQKPHAEILP